MVDEAKKPRAKPKKKATAGSFRKGQSGNPGGRKRLPVETRRALEAAGPEAITKLIALTDAGDQRVALQAQVRVMELVYGKDPMKHVELGSTDATRLAALEAELHRRAVEGDTAALLIALRALAPAKYGPPKDDVGGDVATTVNIVGQGQARPGHRPDDDDA